MGNKQVITYLTPDFIPQDWAQVPTGSLGEHKEMYGEVRTLRHVVTGELIDQYEGEWAMEQDYLFYLHSFNWRMNHPNIVNSKFIEQKSVNGFCSRVYRANIYIQHMQTRLSEIEDIPYPDNLYIIMEALEGYHQLYDHSKYFQVQQDQICVDTGGNIKVWVNADLSRNYADHDHLQSRTSTFGEYEMARDIVHLVAQNTDPELEPHPSFKDYFDKETMNRSCGFESTKVLVNNYAKMHGTEIPARFQAIVSIYNQERGIEDDTSNYGQDRASANFKPISRAAEDDSSKFPRDYNEDLHSEPTLSQPFIQTLSPNIQAYPQPLQGVQSQVFPQPQHRSHTNPYPPPVFSAPTMPWRNITKIARMPAAPQSNLFTFQQSQQDTNRTQHKLPSQVTLQIPQPMQQLIPQAMHQQIPRPMQVQICPPRRQSYQAMPSSQLHYLSRVPNSAHYEAVPPMRLPSNEQGQLLKQGQLPKKGVQQPQALVVQSEVLGRINPNLHAIEQKIDGIATFLRKQNISQNNGDRQASKHEEAIQAEKALRRSETIVLQEVTKLELDSGRAYVNSTALRSKAQSQQESQHLRVTQSEVNSSANWGPKDMLRVNVCEPSGRHRPHELTLQPQEIRRMKYFFSMDEELEVDSDIAADMARYLS